MFWENDFSNKVQPIVILTHNIAERNEMNAGSDVARNSKVRAVPFSLWQTVKT